MEKIDEILSRYSDRSELIDILEDIQEAFGYLSEENMKKVEQTIKIPLVEIYGVATFYTSFKLKPSGRHVIKICSGTSCHVKDADTLHSHLEEKLGIRNGETTGDGRYTLEQVNCIGACALAPAMMIDHEVFGQLTKEKIDSIIEQFK
ncbi:MAG: NADH-quinone oxidoreductase subunit NuoE [Candidatus Altiarchaeota archaeon]|nr:NADH-quinone oxidoreductase subunit NuoE [Candidatus Altiarchaeota archaeon]